jgi:hypothetical protein
MIVTGNPSYQVEEKTRKAAFFHVFKDCFRRQRPLLLQAPLDDRVYGGREIARKKGKAKDFSLHHTRTRL